MFRNVSVLTETKRAPETPEPLDFHRNHVVTVPEAFTVPPQNRVRPARPDEKGHPMRLSFGPTRLVSTAATVAALAAVAALLGSAAAPAATGGAGTVSSSHQCLVMTGSGDPAFVKNFNP